MRTRSILRRALGSGLLLTWLVPGVARGQTEKEINEQAQFWWSINSTLRLTERWGAVGDVHIRRNDFIQDPSFYFLRFGAHRWITDTLAVTLGYAHSWVAPAQEDWHTWTQEDRIYQQIQYSSRLGTVGVLHRLRNEQRWREEVVDDVQTGERELTNRVRYLFSVTIPVSVKPAVPSLVVSDEILVQFGSGVVTNTFDQNRLFAGIKQRVSRDWSFDLGYMLVYQQKASGDQYDLNHTLRWFFYWTPDFTRMEPTHDPAGSEE
jgi:hypothetical protein